MNIGIAGSGNIVKTFLETVKGEAFVDCRAVCVREQSVDKGRSLADEYAIPEVYTNYNDMLADKSIDFIYIGVINPLHFGYAERALLAGKNVILEKPFVCTADEAISLAKIAGDKKLYLFEAITNIYSQNYLIVKRRLRELGDIKLVQCNYSQYSSRYNNYMNGIIGPAFDPDAYGGALYDINIYNIHAVTGLFGSPEKAYYHANFGYNGVDTSGIAILKYDGFTAECCGAKDSQSPGFIQVQGTNGYMRIKGDSNTCPLLEVNISGKTEYYEDKSADRRMLAEFIAFEKMWRENDYQAHLDALRHSVRVMRAAHEAREYAYKN